MQWTQIAEAQFLRGRAAYLRTAKSCGPDAPTLAFKLVMMRAASHGGWWQQSPVTKESSKETVKTIACGNAG